MKRACMRCNHKWKSRNNSYPTICPKCKSRLWDTPQSSKEVSEELNTLCNSIISKADHVDYVTMAPQLLLSIIVSFVEAEKSFTNNGMTIKASKEAGGFLGHIRSLVGAGVIPSEMYDVCWRVQEGYMRDALDMRRTGNTGKSENDLRRSMVNDWDSSVLSDLEFIGTEVTLPDLDRIDILAKDDSGNDVIVELKKGSKDGYKQLRAYSVFYDSPRLINVSEEDVKYKKIGIEYRTFAELHGKSEVIEKQLLIGEK